MRAFGTLFPRNASPWGTWRAVSQQWTYDGPDVASNCAWPGRCTAVCLASTNHVKALYLLLFPFKGSAGSRRCSRHSISRVSSAKFAKSAVSLSNICLASKTSAFIGRFHENSLSWPWFSRGIPREFRFRHRHLFAWNYGGPDRARTWMPRAAA